MVAPTLHMYQIGRRRLICCRPTENQLYYHDSIGAYVGSVLADDRLANANSASTSARLLLLLALLLQQQCSSH